MGTHQLLMRAFLIFSLTALFLALLVPVAEAGLGSRVTARASAIADYLRVLAKEAVVETMGVGLRHFRWFMRACGGEEKAKALLMDAVAEMATAWKESKADVLEIVRKAVKEGDSFHNDNAVEIEALYGNVKEELQKTVAFLRTEIKQASPEQIFLHFSGIASRLAEKHNAAIGVLIEDLAERARQFKEEHRDFVSKLKEDLKERLEEFDERREDQIEEELGDIVGSFFDTIKDNLSRYKSLITYRAVKQYFKGNDWKLSRLPYAQAKAEEHQCRRKCSKLMSVNHLMMGWTQERSSAAGQLLGCQVRCTSKFKTLLPIYYRFCFEQAAQCNHENGVFHHAWAKIFGASNDDAVEHEGYVECARRVEKRIILNSRESHIAKHREFFRPDRIKSKISARVKSLANEMVKVATENAN